MKSRLNLNKKTEIPKIPDVKPISLDILKQMADPIRTRLMGLVSNAPATVQELASTLKVPITRLYYHVHLLEEIGLIQVIDSHPVGGTVEKVYYASARQFIVDRAQFSGRPSALVDYANVLIDFSLTETGKAIRKSIKSGALDLQKSAPDPRALQIRRGIGKLSTKQAIQFYKKLENLISEFTNMDQEDGEAAEYMLAVAFFPTSIAEKE